MPAHLDRAATKQIAPRRRNPLGERGLRAPASSLLEGDVPHRRPPRSSPNTRKTLSRRPGDFRHGLLAVYFGLLCSVSLCGQERFHQVCAACHTAEAEDFSSHPHLAAGLDCDTCHGASRAHREASGHVEPDRVAAPDQMADLCGPCHALEAEEFNLSAHGKLVAALSKTRAPHCGTCHGVHRVRSAAAMERRCRACHSQRPEACGAAPPVKISVGCAGCHAPPEFHNPREAGP